MTEQNIHLSRIYFRGNIKQSSGVEDNTKLVKTKGDGRLHHSLLDIFPILKETNHLCKDIILPSTIYACNEDSYSNVVTSHNFDEVNRLSYIQATSNENSQKINFVSEYNIPYLFKEWETNALNFSCKVSDKDNISINAYLYTQTSLSSSIYTVLYSSMTKVEEVGYDIIEFTITKDNMYANIPTIKFGDNNSGISTITLLLKINLDANEWIKINLGGIEYNYTNTLLELDYDDGWPDCEECDESD